MIYFCHGCTSRNLGFLLNVYQCEQNSWSWTEATSDNETNNNMIDVVTVESNGNTCDSRDTVEKDNNRENQKITADNIIEEFPLMFIDEVKVMKGEELKICLEDEAVRFCLTPPGTILYAYGTSWIN